MPSTPVHTAVSDTCRHIGEVIARYAGARDGDGYYETDVPGLGFVQTSTPNHMVGNISEPFLAIIIQGRKEVMLGD
eukprot:gene14098-17846_t